MEELLNCFLACDLERLKVLLKTTGINSRVPGTDGFTPLHVVAGIDSFSSKEIIMSYLLDNGADPNARSDENLTPVHIAAMWDRCFQLEKLLQHGGNPWLTDDNNKNSFDMACDNHCYEAEQLLNIYLAENKFNFKIEEREPRKLTFSTPQYDDTPSYFEDYQNENLHNSFNLTFMTAKESKFNSPATFSTPGYLENSRTENLNDTANCTFMSARENLPVIFSSSDESDECSSDCNEFMKKLSLKCDQNGDKQDKTGQGENQDNCTSNVEIDQCTNKVNVDDQCTNKFNVDTLNHDKNIIEKYNNLNKAYIFTSSSDASDTTTSDLNQSGDSTSGTIIDCDDDDDSIVLIKVKNKGDSLYSSNASICSVPNDWKSYHNEISDCSTLSYCSSHSKSSLVVPDEVHRYSNSKIFQELRDRGDNPGPVLDHTRHVYLHRLARLISGCVISCELPKPKYCPEVYLFLENKLDMDRAIYLEQNIEEEFDAESSRVWREGNQRCCFNYFLLDPRVTQNLPQRAKQLSDEQVFLTFLDSLFYVGKGTRGRPYSHLFEAAKSVEDERPRSAKVNHILDIWDAGLGVISLHCFQNSIPAEAYTKEACIIEAVGLQNLTNIKKGDFYGLCARLTTSRKRLIGISLLDKALQIFLLEGERFIKPKDIGKK